MVVLLVVRNKGTPCPGNVRRFCIPWRTWHVSHAHCFSDVRGRSPRWLTTPLLMISFGIVMKPPFKPTDSQQSDDQLRQRPLCRKAQPLCVLSRCALQRLETLAIVRVFCCNQVHVQSESARKVLWSYINLLNEIDGHAMQQKKALRLLAVLLNRSQARANCSFASLLRPLAVARRAQQRADQFN